jgi:CheY-like chemotaxis protein
VLLDLLLPGLDGLETLAKTREVRPKLNIGDCSVGDIMISC